MSESRRLKDLKLNPKNPRKISEEKLSFLKRALGEFGDLSGIVENARTGRLVGGHQRTKVLSDGAAVVLTKTYEKPTKTGTIALGYILSNGERYSFRRVDWDETREKAANIAANRGAGEWDLETLSEWMREIDDFGFDLDLTMFDSDERADLLVPTLQPNFEPGSEEDQSKLDEKKKVICPECGHLFKPE